MRDLFKGLFDDDCDGYMFGVDFRNVNREFCKNYTNDARQEISRETEDIDKLTLQIMELEEKKRNLEFKQEVWKMSNEEFCSKISKCLYDDAQPRLCLGSIEYTEYHTGEDIGAEKFLNSTEKKISDQVDELLKVVSDLEEHIGKKDE